MDPEWKKGGCWQVYRDRIAVSTSNRKKERRRCGKKRAVEGRWIEGRRIIENEEDRKVTGVKRRNSSNEEDGDKRGIW